MSRTAAEFFDRLGRHGHEPLLDRISATIRFEFTGDEPGEHRLVRIDHGDIDVSAGDGPADCVLGAERAVFDDIVTGRTSVMAALMRGELAVDGDPLLLVLSRRLFLAAGFSGRGEAGKAEGRPTP